MRAKKIYVISDGIANYTKEFIKDLLINEIKQADIRQLARLARLLYNEPYRVVKK